MREFRNMRDRVDYAYEQLNVDMIYEGNACFTIIDHNNGAVIEMVSQELLDVELYKIWEAKKQVVATR